MLTEDKLTQLMCKVDKELGGNNISRIAKRCNF